MTRHTIFLDGAFIPADSRMIESLSPGHLKARGVFETMAADSGKIVLLDQHLMRLKKGLEILEIKSPYSNQKLREYIDTLLSQFVSLRPRRSSAGEAISLKDCFVPPSPPSLCLALRSKAKQRGRSSGGPRNDATQNARVRLTIWQDHTKTHASIVSLPYEPFSQRQYEQGFQAMISKIRFPRSPRWSCVKSLDCSSLFQAYAEAKSQGYDEALILNAKGCLAEASRSNIFFVVKGELWTPALSCGGLKGITRGVVIAVAKEMGIKVKMVQLRLSQIKRAQEAFLTNSLIGIMPLTSIDGKTIGQGKMGNWTREIRERANLQFSVCPGGAR